MKVIDKSVTDNPQIAEKKGEEIIVISKFKKNIAFKYRFKIDEIQRFKPTFNESYNLNQFIRTKIKELKLKWFNETEPFYTRIIDSQRCAISKILNGDLK